MAFSKRNAGKYSRVSKRGGSAKRAVANSKARAKTVAKARGRLANSAVKKVYAHKRVNQSSNYLAISTLARQVKQLQYDRNGFKQWQHVHTEALPSYPATVPAEVQNYRLRPLRTRPYAFMVNDFLEHSDVFYGYIFPGTNIPASGVASRFTPVLSTQNVAPEYQWNNKQTQESISEKHYLPIKSTMRFSITANSGPTQTPITVRITMLKFKNAGSGHVVTKLPTALGAYQDLVTTNPADRNYFNTHEYHTILSDRYVKFNQTDVARNDINKIVSMRYTNNSTEPLNPDITASPTDQEMWNVIPTKDQVWCVISTDCTDYTRLTIRLDKWNTWRDATGMGN